MRISGGAAEAESKTGLPDAVIDVAGSLICVIDKEGRVVRWNQAASALTGISENAIRGRTLQEIIPFSGDAENWKRELAGVISGSAASHLDCRWRMHDGSIRTLTCYCSAIRDEADAAGYIVCTAFDSTAELDRLSRELMADRTAKLLEVSRFLHDTVSQDLVALSFKINELETGVAQTPGRVTAGDLIARCCRSVRLIGYMMAPPALGEGTLEDSLRCYLSHLRDETGLAVRADIDSVPGTLPIEKRLLLFAAVQEMATHWIRTAPDAALSVRLENTDSETVLTLEMIFPSPKASLQGHVEGWVLIRERARALAGEFHTTGGSERVSVTISFPVPAEQ